MKKDNSKKNIILLTKESEKNKDIKILIESLDGKFLFCRDFEEIRKSVLLDSEIIIIYRYSKKEEDIQKVIDYLNNINYKGKIYIGDSVFREILKHLPDSLYKKIGNVPFFPITTLTKYGEYNLCDRIFDIMGSCTLILLFSPVLLLVPVLIKMSSPGPIFYISERVGYKGKVFKFFKFRSLKVVSEEKEENRKKRILEAIRNNKKGVSKIVDADRLTPIGKFLRKSSIDELPQFLNVLKGDMSLIGPRPCLVYEWENYTDWQKRRFDIMPGCTGIWQIYGKGKVSFNEMVAMDMYIGYNKSMLLKLRLILETFRFMLKLKGDL